MKYTLRYSHKEYWCGINSFFLPRSHDRSLQNEHNTPPKASDSLQLLQTRPILHQFRNNFGRKLHAKGVAESWQRFLASTSTRHCQGSTPSIAWFWRDATPPLDHLTTTFVPLLSIPIASFHVQRSRSLDFATSTALVDALFEGGYSYISEWTRVISRLLNWTVPRELIPSQWRGHTSRNKFDVCHCFSRGPVGCYSCVRASL